MVCSGKLLLCYVLFFPFFFFWNLVRVSWESSCDFWITGDFWAVYGITTCFVFVSFFILFYYCSFFTTSLFRKYESVSSLMHCLFILIDSFEISMIISLVLYLFFLFIFSIVNLSLGILVGRWGTGMGKRNPPRRGLGTGTRRILGGEEGEWRGTPVPRSARVTFLKYDWMTTII